MVLLGFDPTDRTMMVGGHTRNQDDETHPSAVTDETLTSADED